MNFIHISQNTLDNKTCKNFISEFENHPWLQISGQTGNSDGLGDNNSKIKQSTDIGIDQTFLHDEKFGPLIQKLIDFLNSELEIYKKKFPDLDLISNWGLREKFNLQRYYPGEGYFGWHCEHNPLNPVLSSRVIAWTTYLNTVDDGGTEYRNFGTVDAVEGRCVFWPAYWTHFHRGIVSNTKTKYIATGWYNFME
jgi:prolyl 4-hydroxylase